MQIPISKASVLPSDPDTAVEVQLCVMVAPGVRAQVRAAAAARGVTLRALVLGALRDAGVLPGIADADLADRRAVLAAAKARLWRERGGAAASREPGAPRGRGRAGGATP
ncbi:hypothetical protein [Paracraurococcus lichenis]|uniref:Ribbon-helix-helix protein CopG domain-containing protein n=1 Tax=Paracraurococcus lichenis TaxID=3064888 RepID=A0ABT9EAS7_9PROT|nr:hypothetical protein [Paracraurococcus sp. LOR1-02]MDO9713312.1 hypothetical protein [Paracraurococcus sp. LOR1-02]